jgi:hypothetical protein
VCGQGYQQRERECLHGGLPGDDRMCMGQRNETKTCYRTSCTGGMQEMVEMVTSRCIATPNPFLLNEICLNQQFTHLDISIHLLQCHPRMYPGCIESPRDPIIQTHDSTRTAFLPPLPLLRPSVTQSPQPRQSLPRLLPFLRPRRRNEILPALKILDGDRANLDESGFRGG